MRKASLIHVKCINKPNVFLQYTKVFFFTVLFPHDDAMGIFICAIIIIFLGTGSWQTTLEKISWELQDEYLYFPGNVRGVNVRHAYADTLYLFKKKNIG